MPAHDSLEHCAVMGYLCQPNGSKIPARRWGRAGCTQACLQDRSPTARRTGANSIQPPGREDVVLIISGLQVLKGRLGRFATKGVCRSRDGWLWVPALSPVHRDWASWEQIWGKIFISLTQEKNRHLPASTKGITSSYQCHVDLS